MERVGQLAFILGELEALCEHMIARHRLLINPRTGMYAQDIELAKYLDMLAELYPQLEAALDQFAGVEFLEKVEEARDRPDRF